MVNKTVIKNFESGGIRTIPSGTYPPFGQESSYVKTSSYQASTTQVGKSVPGWKAKLRNHENAVSAYSVTDTNIHKTPGHHTYTVYANGSMPIPPGGQYHSPQTYSLQGSFAPLVPFSADYGPLQFSVINTCELEWLLKARKKQTLFQGATFIGELGESLRMIRDRAGRLNKLIENHLGAIRKNRKRWGKTRKKRKKFVRQAWLETTFGWLPLVSDTEDAAQALAETVNRMRNEVMNVYHSVNFSDSYPMSAVTNKGVGAHGFRQVSQSTAEIGCQYYGAVKINLGGPGGLFDTDLWGFSPRDFFPTLWELIPWSWAIDYFSNVGKCISAWSFGSSNLVWSGRSVRTKLRCKTFWHPNLNNIWGSDLISISGSPAITEVESFRLDRQQFKGEMPWITFGLQYPGLKKSLNLAAVLSQHDILTKQLNTF